MLILTRRPTERIMIGRDIVVTVLSTGSGQCRIGVEAPKDISVHREEVARRIEREQAAAQQQGPAHG